MLQEKWNTFPSSSKATSLFFFDMGGQLANFRVAIRLHEVRTCAQKLLEGKVCCRRNFLKHRVMKEERNEVLESLNRGNEFVKGSFAETRRVELTNSVEVFESSASYESLIFEGILGRHWGTRRMGFETIKFTCT
jgi:hypothetical protein